MRWWSASLHLRFRLWRRGSHHSRLSLLPLILQRRPPLLLWLRSNALWLWRVSYRRLCSLRLRLRPRLLRSDALWLWRVSYRGLRSLKLRLITQSPLILSSLLLRSPAHLLARNHLLSRGFTLCLLLLSQQLVRLRRHRLTDTLGLRIGLRPLFSDLLLSQLLKLLSCAAITAS